MYNVHVGTVFEDGRTEDTPVLQCTLYSTPTCTCMVVVRESTWTRGEMIMDIHVQDDCPCNVYAICSTIISSAQRVTNYYESTLE